HDALPISAEAEPIREMKIAWSIDLDYMQIDPEVRRNTLVAVDVFRSLGCKVEEVKLGWTGDIERAAMHWYNTMHFCRQTVWWKKTQAHLMTDYALKLAEAVEETTRIDDVHRAWETSHRMYQTLGPVLATHDVFVCPTLAVPAVAAEHDPWHGNFRI